jgi:hypothetical protein
MTFLSARLPQLDRKSSHHLARAQQAVPLLHGTLGATAQLQLAAKKREAAAAKAGGKQKQPVLQSAQEPFESLPAAHQEWIKQNHCICLIGRKKQKPI